MQELRAAGAKQADTSYMCCWCGVVWYGIWKVKGVSPYVGIRIGGRVQLWRIADWLRNDKKTAVESQAESSTTQVYLGFVRQNRHNAF